MSLFASNCLGRVTFAKHADSDLASKDFGKRGIRVNAIAPGFIATPMTDKLRESVGEIIKDTSEQLSSLGRGGKPHEPAALIAFLLSDEASFVSI